MNEPIIRRKHEEAQNHFILVRNAFSIQDKKDFLAFDIKAYEHDYSKVLEIGYVIVRFSPSVRHGTEGNLPKAEVIDRQHLIIEENLHLIKNKDNVPDNEDEFTFGVSKTLSLEDAVERFLFVKADLDYITFV
jgi:predicted metallo-beta-lactamase superfamily hydrolase